MTYKDAINELVELSMHEDCLHEMVRATCYSDEFARRFYGVDSWLVIGELHAKAVWAFMDRAEELWHELGGYELDYSELDLRRDAINRADALYDEFERKPTVYRFTEFGDNLDDCYEFDDYSNDWRDDEHDEWHSHETERQYLALIDELEAKFDAA